MNRTFELSRTTTEYLFIIFQSINGCYLHLYPVYWDTYVRVIIEVTALNIKTYSIPGWGSQYSIFTRVIWLWVKLKHVWEIIFCVSYIHHTLSFIWIVLNAHVYSRVLRRYNMDFSSIVYTRSLTWCIWSGDIGFLPMSNEDETLADDVRHCCHM
jgi:hypothetical protein